MRPHVKICGITRLEDALLAATLGASAVGLVFWPGSPRFIDPHRARTIVGALPPWMSAVGVFVDQPPAHVSAVAGLVRLNAVQLHGDEDVATFGAVRHRIIKAVPVREDFDPASVDTIPTSMTVLLDAHDPVKRGGTGRTINWDAAAAVAGRRATILSGGLTPDNVSAAIARVRPRMVDVSSGVESAPGRKDAGRLRALFEAVDRAE